MYYFDENELVYVQGVGYGTLLSCGRRKRVLKRLEGRDPPDVREDILKSVDSEQLEVLMIMMNGIGGLDESPPPPEVPLPEEPEDQADPNTVKVKLKKSGALVFTPEDTLSKSVELRVKTFFGRRQEVKVTVSIGDLFSKVVATVLQQIAGDHSSQFYNTRLFYPHWFLQELNLTKAVRDEEIPSGAKLVLLVQQAFSLKLRSEGLRPANNDLTVSLAAETEFCETALGSLLMESGKHYWEVKIDKANEPEGIFVGVAAPDTELRAHPLSLAKYWAFVPMCAKKVGVDLPNPNMCDYGTVCHVGDRIGVLVDFRNGQASLSFFRNGLCLGQAFSGLEGPLRPAVSLFTGDKQLTLDTRSQSPIIDFLR